MLKITIIAAAVFVTCSAAASADDVRNCDEVSIKMVAEAIVAATDPEYPDRAQTGNMELEAAKQSMKDGKQQDCVMHLNMAMQALNQQ